MQKTHLGEARLRGTDPVDWRDPGCRGASNRNHPVTSEDVVNSEESENSEGKMKGDLDLQRAIHHSCQLPDLPESEDLD